MTNSRVSESESNKQTFPAASQHVSVMPRESLSFLALEPGMTVVDGTLGGGGHTRLLAEAVGPSGQVIAIDRDPAAIDRAARELAGLPIPAHVEGKSLVPLLRGEDATLHEAALTQMSHGRGKNGAMGWSIRTRRYRYTEWRSADFSTDTPAFGNHAQATELYDYETDPLERENLAAKVDHAAVLKEHQALFDQLLPRVPTRK